MELAFPLFLAFSCTYEFYNPSVISLSPWLFCSWSHVFLRVYRTTPVCPTHLWVSSPSLPDWFLFHIYMRVLGHTVACIHVCVLRCIIVLPIFPLSRLCFALGFYLSIFCPFLGSSNALFNNRCGFGAAGPQSA